MQADKTPYPLVQRAVTALGRDRILGVVLNQADGTSGRLGYDYSKYYDSYGR